MISEDVILEELERIQFDFESLDIPVKCNKTLEEFDVGDRKVKLVKGMRMKIPYWLAILLNKEGYVDLEEIENLDFPALYRLAIKEGENIDLQKINNFFYLSIKQLFEDYIKKGKAAPYRQKESIEMKLRELMTMRLSKIIKIAEKGKNITSKTRNMTPEEKWLYETVSDFVEKWKDMVKASEEKIEE